MKPDRCARFVWLCGVLVVCAHCSDKPAKPASGTAAPLTRSVISAPVNPAEIPADVRVACDSAAAIMREALALDIKRFDGNYQDSPRGGARLGCRLTTTGHFKALRNEAGPVDLLQQVFARHGWRQDIRYGADGPDGATIGMRRLDKLCMASGRWEGGDDSDTITPPDPDPTYDAIVECARDVASNADSDVPDSIWRIAARAGLDSLYAISYAVQSPPYLAGDFDGDGVADGAVLVERRASGKLGIAVVLRGPGQVVIISAGSHSPGPDDLAWMNAWDTFQKGTYANLSIGDRPLTRAVIGDAIWVARRDSLNAFYMWDGKEFVYESHKL